MLLAWRIPTDRKPAGGRLDIKNQNKSIMSLKLENLRLRLSKADALPQLALMGILSGLLAGAVIVLFRLAIESLQLQFLPGQTTHAYLPGHTLENYEQLPMLWRFMLPVLGGLALGLMYWLLTRNTMLQVGVVHVMERLVYYQGVLPLRNMLLQFLGAVMSIVSGFSAGREGPGIHLGAASGSLIGQYMKLPNNSIRILVASGAAAAIAASFNTPLAGVVFAMEVIMMEYTLAGFTPVILASVTAATLTRFVFGNEIAFTVMETKIANLSELPYIAAAGLLIGGLAALFISLIRKVNQFALNKPMFLRMSLAGLLTGLIALYAPASSIMGVGYDTVNSALTGSLAGMTLTVLLIILLAKIVATATTLGLGVPAGLIGPTLFIGAIAGVIAGSGAKMLYADPSSAGYYALLGMGAMMGATLQAPLAALTAMLEMTQNSDIILPGMLIIVMASMTCRELFGRKSVFIELMQVRGLDYRHDPVSQSLLRLGVAGAMDRDIESLPAQAPLDRVHVVLDQNPRWIIIIDENRKPLAMMPTADLAHAYLELTQYQSGAGQPQHDKLPQTLDLMEIPAKRKQLAPVSLQANLQQALDTLQQTGAEALYVYRYGTAGAPHIYGILTKSLIEETYHKGV